VPRGGSAARMEGSIDEVTLGGSCGRRRGGGVGGGTSIRSASEFALMHRRSIFRAGSLQADLTG